MLWRDEASRLKSLLNSEEYVNEIEYYKNVDVLYIDDLFKTGKSENQQTQRPTSADINLAFEILNNRAMKNKTTIISTECIIEELIDIDRAIAGRIKQMCGELYCLSIDRDKNKDYRLKEG
jgi:DNA replication protein DnaC